MDGAQITNGFIDHAIRLEKERIALSLEVVISNQLQRLSRKISTARAGYEASKEAQIAQLTENDALEKVQLLDELEALREELKALRQNRIMQLEEAIAIAKALGIKKPTTPSSLGNTSRSTGNVIRTEVNSHQNPLYFMGTEALNAERDTLLVRKNDEFTSARIVDIKTKLKLLEHNRKVEMLKARENEDLFLSELAENRKEISRLKNLKVDMDKLKIVHIDQVAIEPVSPVKPNKKMIVAVGFVLGGMLGLFIALIRSMIRRRKALAHSKIA
jgi:LPS O-antigen subunit length determinant protein (WzzB/FepE family)